MLVALLLGVGIWQWRTHRYDEKAIIQPVSPSLAVAYFAGGCFWCTESDFEKVPGVVEVISGYQGGHLKNPTYVEVTKETTGHRETVEVRYDSTKVSYERLVAHFFSHIDPTDAGGSFVDRGESYTSAIFYNSTDELMVINAEIARLTSLGAYPTPIVTTILPYSTFWPAEEYHQDFYKKSSLRYEYYRNASGRDQKLSEQCAYRATKGAGCVSL